MVHYSEDSLRKMRRATKRRWIRNLDRVWEAYEKETMERPWGVPPITKYFGRKDNGNEARTSVAEPGRKMAGNPARKPNESASPQGDAVS